jgi:hypothetical protein
MATTKKRNTPQRVYCLDCISKSGPNINPPNNIAHTTTHANAKLAVTPHAAANVSGASSKVIASCVFPEGIKSRVTA